MVGTLAWDRQSGAVIGPPRAGMGKSTSTSSICTMLGITVVRWFVLADGLTYGTGDSAPTLSAGRWRFDPPVVGTDILEHFDELLQRISAFNTSRPEPVRLLPVLIDFHFCSPGSMPVLQPDPFDPLRTVANPGWVKQGRADAILDPAKRRRFFDRVLGPLLEVSQHHRDVIFAWELMNEPEWITNTWHPDGRNNHPIDQRVDARVPRGREGLCPSRRIQAHDRVRPL